MQLPHKTLNYALNLSLEFGENWLVDIQDRLSKKYPELSKTELDYCKQLCEKINKLAHQYVANNPKKIGAEIKFTENSKFKEFIKKKYNWINDNNIKKIYSQSCYYAMK